ncbi:MAG: hypothetical protein ACLP5V_04110 [Candidatus Bathyarchaeia archaeon]
MPKGKIKRRTLKVQLPLTERLDNVSLRLHRQLEKLANMHVRLQARETALLERCISEKKSNHLKRAMACANALTEVRRVSKVVLSSEVAIESIIIRIETIREFANAKAQMAPVMNLVKKTGERIAGIMPQVSSELAEVNGILYNVLRDATGKRSEVAYGTSRIRAPDTEAKPLRETSTDAEHIIADELDQVRDDLGQLIEGRPPGDIEKTAPTKEEVDMEKEIYKYAKNQDGQISLQKYALDLGISPDEVLKGLLRLQRERRVLLEF